MSFCTRLRRRSSCSDLIPVITSPQGLFLRENELVTHDLAIPMKSFSANSTRQLRVILLTPSSALPENVSTTLTRLELFASLTGAVDIAVAFHMSPSQTPQTTAQHSGMTAFFALIAAIFTHTSISALPVLPLASATSLTTVLKTFASSLLKGQSVATKASHGVRATDLLHHCTTNPPLDQHSTYLMTDMFDSLQGLAGAMTGSTEDNEREQKMIDFLGLDLAQSVADFWRDEWVAD